MRALSALVATALVATVVDPAPWQCDAVVAELAAELVTVPLDLDVLAALVAIALVAAPLDRGRAGHRGLGGSGEPRWRPGSLPEALRHDQLLS